MSTRIEWLYTLAVLHASQGTQFVSMLKSNQLMTFEEIMVFISRNCNTNTAVFFCIIFHTVHFFCVYK
jgi:hypothetical protein